MAQGERTKIISCGRAVGVLYPEVYFIFVSELYKEHDDIVRAMVLAQVKLEDGSAIDFLNMLLGTNVSKDSPMEIGYAELLDAMRMRVKSPQATKDMERVAASFKSHELASFPERDPSKPIFPDEPTQ